MTDLRILAALADALGSDLGFRTPVAAMADLDELGIWDGTRAAAPRVSAQGAADGIVLASWRELLDDSRGTDYELALRATARPAMAKLSQATADKYGITDVVQVSAGGRTQLLPVGITETILDEVVWVPTNAGGAFGRPPAAPGASVTIAAVAIDEGDQE